MKQWSSELNELEKYYKTIKDQAPDLEKELAQLVDAGNDVVVLLYSRRCLEVIVTDVCEREMNRPRKTEPLKGVIDKLNKEEKVPSHIIASMLNLNTISTYGAHPKEFDPRQVRTVLINLVTIIEWYLKYKDAQISVKAKPEEKKYESKVPDDSKECTGKPQKKLIIMLSGLFLGVVIVIVVLFVFNIIGGRKSVLDMTEFEKSITVLPFISLSDDPEKQYLADGIMDAILLHLSKIEDLRVMSRTSAEQYRKTNKTASVIGQELGVAYLLEGSFQKYGDNARLIVQLIKTSDDSHLWSNEYDRDWKDIFSVQSEVAQTIARELHAVITPEEKQLIEKIPTADLAAYDAYLKGQFYFRKLTQNDLETAMQYFELAKDKDPEYALAYAGICDVWIGLQQMGYVSPAEAGPKAMAALMRALELDSTYSEVQYTLALMNTWVMWDWKGGESAFKKAIALNPNHAEAHALYSHLLNMVGRPKEAMEQIELALKLDPHNPLLKSLYGTDLLFVHQFDEAILVSREALEMDPTNPVALAALFEALHLTGSYEEAFEAGKLNYCNIYKNIAHTFDQGYAKAGYVGALNLAADSLVVHSKTTYVNPTEISILYASIGNKERALEYLEQAYEMHDPNTPYLLLPIYDSLRNDPRFQDLCRKMNLPCKQIK